MNAFTPLAALLGAPNVTINLTINGGVFSAHVEAPEPTLPEVSFIPAPDVVYVNGNGLAQLGVLADDDADSLRAAQEFKDAFDAVFAPPAAPSRARPTVGRIVHYHPRSSERLHHGSKGSAPWAALITGVYEIGDDGEVISVIAFPPGQRGYVPFEALRELPAGVEFDPFGVESFWSFPARS